MAYTISTFQGNSCNCLSFSPLFCDLRISNSNYQKVLIRNLHTTFLLTRGACNTNNKSNQQLEFIKANSCNNCSIIPVTHKNIVTINNKLHFLHAQYSFSAQLLTQISSQPYLRTLFFEKDCLSQLLDGLRPLLRLDR